MPPRTHILAEAERFLGWLRSEVGGELRLARHNAGATMQLVADRLGCSKSKISRIERGLSPCVTLADITAFAAVVGLRPYLKLYPLGPALRDIGQVELLAGLNARLSPRWHSEHEVLMPKPGDLRAADQVSTMPGCRLMVEAFRRFSDYQAQSRAARAKQRDLGADRLLLLLEGTRTNRRALAAAGLEPRRSFPIPQRAMLAALAAGRDPGGDGIVLLRRLSGAGAATPATPANPANPATPANPANPANPAVAPDATKGEGAAAPPSRVSPGATHDV